MCSWPLPLHAPAVQAALSHTKGSTRAYRRPAAKAWCTHRNVVEQVALLGGCLHGFQRHVEGDVAAGRGGRASSSSVNMRKTPFGSLIASRGHVGRELDAPSSCETGMRVWARSKAGLRQEARCASCPGSPVRQPPCRRCACTATYQGPPAAASCATVTAHQ